jgi:pimeloyl-ACP methyl ester carboxylesterase
MGMLLAAAFLADRLGAAHILGAAMVVLGLSMLWRLLPDPFDSGALIGDLLFILARHHADPDSPFWGWNHAWLNPAFRQWNLEADIVGIRCPVLAIQGEGDEYASMAQIDGIQRIVPHTHLLKLADCGHSPHRDQAAAVTEATLAFLRSVGFAQL